MIRRFLSVHLLQCSSHVQHTNWARQAPPPSSSAVCKQCIKILWARRPTSQVVASLTGMPQVPSSREGTPPASGDCRSGENVSIPSQDQVPILSSMAQPSAGRKQEPEWRECQYPPSQDPGSLSFLLHRSEYHKKAEGEVARLSVMAMRRTIRVHRLCGVPLRNQQCSKLGVPSVAGWQIPMRSSWAMRSTTRKSEWRECQYPLTQDPGSHSFLHGALGAHACYLHPVQKEGTKTRTKRPPAPHIFNAIMGHSCLGNKIQRQPWAIKSMLPSTSNAVPFCKVSKAWGWRVRVCCQGSHI